MSGYFKYLIFSLFFLLHNCKQHEKEKLKSIFVATGKASWYGPGFQGKPTASGSFFDMNKLTAAHRWLEFGTLVKVTNLKNDKDVVVEINDRGPVSKLKLLDLSRSAAEEIGLVKAGITDVEIEIVGYSHVDMEAMIKHYNNLLTIKMKTDL